LRLNTPIWGGLFILALAQTPVFATTIVFNGPQDRNGLNCDPATDGHCVIGAREEFQMFSAALTSPTVPGGQWNLKIETNYGVALPGSGGDVIPSFLYGRGTFAMCDFMITWNNIDYGIVMHAHDGYTPGYLYQVNDGFQTSGQVMSAQGEDSPRPEMAVLIAAGGSLRGVGTLTATANPGANGLTQALYEVQVAFSAPSNFLSSGLFTVRACSYECANGYILGNGKFDNPVPTGQDSGVPEPSTLVMMLAGIGALGAAKLRKRVS